MIRQSKVIIIKNVLTQTLAMIAQEWQHRGGGGGGGGDDDEGDD